MGVGHGVTAVLARHQQDNLFCRGVNVGANPTTDVWPDGRQSGDMFKNLKAELWWKARTHFQRAYEHVVEEVAHDPSDMIAIPRHPALVNQLSLPRWFRDERGKIVMESKQQLLSRGIRSPDYADAFVLTLAGPIQEDWTGAQLGAGGSA